MLDYLAIKATQNGLKIVLSILLLLCLFEWPYAYYQVVRIFASLSFSFLAYQAYQDGENKKLYFYLILLILFQPLLKISLGRVMWNIVDVMLALILLLSVFRSRFGSK